MDKAELILYGFATYLAIKSLISLMSEHRTHYKKKLAAELKARAAAAPPPAPPVQNAASQKPQRVGARATAKSRPAEAKPQAAGKT
jgi:hypothetical protein